MKGISGCTFDGVIPLPEQQKIQGLATRAYYERSLLYLRRLGLDGPVYLATDSPSAVREELAGMGSSF